MKRLIDHLVKLTDFRDRDLLELTLSKALLDMLPLQRIVIARVLREDGQARWLEVARLDARGGGRVSDPARVDVASLPRIEDEADRLRCLRSRERVDTQPLGPLGPCVTMLPLFSELRPDDEGVIELHSEQALDDAAWARLEPLRHVYRNMYALLEFSDRDPMTGLLNRKSLDDAFYSAVLEDLQEAASPHAHDGPDHERRHHVPANYWLGSITVDNYALIAQHHGYEVSQDVLQTVARIVNNTFRRYDRRYHFDREQFAVLMHCPDEALVLTAFERLRAAMEKTQMPQVGRVTLSCGFTPVSEDDTPESALAKTDQAVDFARRSGGNKACNYAGLAQRGILGT